MKTSSEFFTKLQINIRIYINSDILDHFIMTFNKKSNVEPEVYTDILKHIGGWLRPDNLFNSFRLIFKQTPCHSF